MLYLIGLGLGDAKDITVKGLEVVKRCSRVYLEAYTSILTVGKEALEEFYGRKLIVADREEVEQKADNILEDADLSDVAFLVVGDPFGATTHSDLVLRAAKRGIPYRVIHNASIMNAVGCCGLQLYKFGETVSIVFWTDTWRPESFFDKVKKNRQNGMHTLCLLDIKVKEQSLENLIKGRKIYEPPQYMSVNQAAQQLLEIVQNQRIRGEEPGLCCKRDHGSIWLLCRLGPALLSTMGFDTNISFNLTSPPALAQNKRVSLFSEALKPVLGM
ncbi:diphthine methyl ester synthase isoform X3 [Elephas maximus indicus]|uniref:diphthine methyl ester synthase isoform X3 n=1 Tax=Elephas maximus indicus TaxID=99487 RepID=UPI00211603A9|nr:diphthine methyl ester synthase isoform X3 [Elephas maximus indicus]